MPDFVYFLPAQFGQSVLPWGIIPRSVAGRIRLPPAGISSRVPDKASSTRLLGRNGPDYFVSRTPDMNNFLSWINEI
jgi:hypothetical protein